MFDIGIWELAIVALVALLVLNPRQIPKTISEIYYYAHKLRTFVIAAKQRVVSEIEAIESNVAIVKSKQSVTKAIDETKQSLTDFNDEVLEQSAHIDKQNKINK